MRASLLRLSLATSLVAAPLPVATANDSSPGLPTLSVTLKPGGIDAEGKIPSVEVLLELPSTRVDGGKALLRMSRVASNVVTVATEIQDLRVTDAGGDVPLAVEDEPELGLNADRIWTTGRDVTGPVTVHYRAPITNAPLVRGAAPPFNLRSENGGFSAAGNAFLMLPAGDEHYRVRLRWDLSTQPAGAVGLSSLGIGDAALEDAPAERLSDAYYMAGTVGLYPADGRSTGYFGGWQGKPPFDAAGLLAWGDELHRYYSRFFGESAPGAYGVFMRPNPVNPGGGVELTNSFALTYDEKTELPDLKITLAHEMLHTWVNSLDEPKGLLSSWFSEGMAVYYARTLALRSGMISPEAFLDDLNMHAGRYYTNALANTPNADIPKRFWADTRVRVLPYDRASLYFAHVDAQIRAKSRGRRSLDDLLLALLAQRKAGKPITQTDWEKLVAGELGDQGRAEFAAMMNGALVLPSSDAFGPCFRRTTKTLRRFELGFDPTSLIKSPRIIRGVVPGSAADRAGLRDGDEIMKPVGQDGLQGRQDGYLVLDVRRGEDRVEIRYQPRGEQVEAYQWALSPNAASGCSGGTRS